MAMRGRDMKYMGNRAHTHTHATEKKSERTNRIEQKEEKKIEKGGIAI